MLIVIYYNLFLKTSIIHTQPSGLNIFRVIVPKKPEMLHASPTFFSDYLKKWSNYMNISCTMTYTGSTKISANL